MQFGSNPVIAPKIVERANIKLAWDAQVSVGLAFRNHVWFCMKFEECAPLLGSNRAGHCRIGRITIKEQA